MKDIKENSSFGDPTRPLGRNTMVHASTTRLYFKKRDSEKIICKIYNLPLIAEKKCFFGNIKEPIVDSE